MSAKLLGLKTLSNNLFVTSGGEREQIVGMGRLLYRENAAKTLNEIAENQNSKVAKETKYRRILTDEQYETANGKYLAAFHNHVGKIYAARTGSTWDESKWAENIRNPYLASDKDYLKVMAAVISEVISPVTPAVTSDIMGHFAATAQIGWKENYEVTINSNAVFNWEETTWGASNQRAQYLYDKTIVARPKPITARARMKWYQFIGKDMGALFNAMGQGLYGTIMGKFQNVLNGVTSSSSLIPAPYRAEAFDIDNFIRVSQNVSIANADSKVACFGYLGALNKVMPSVSTALGMQYGLGEKWARVGYIDSFMSVGLFEIKNAFVPNTANTTAEHVVDDKNLYFAATNGGPIIHNVFEGGQIGVELTPTNTADMTFDIKTTASMDVIVPLGSRIGVIKGVV